jgi:hypothetical protein
MAETLGLRCDDGEVLFTFYSGPKGVPMVEITVGVEKRHCPLRVFHRDMLPISELAVEWTKKSIRD